MWKTCGKHVENSKNAGITQVFLWTSMWIAENLLQFIFPCAILNFQIENREARQTIMPLRTVKNHLTSCIIKFSSERAHRKIHMTNQKGKKGYHCRQKYSKAGIEKNEKMNRDYKI